MGSDAFRINGPQFSASRIHSRWGLVLSTAAVLNYQLLGSIADGIWCIEKQRISIFSCSDLFQMPSGAFKSNGPRFSASRIHSKSDLVHSKASVLRSEAILNPQILGSNPDEIWCIQKQRRSSIFSFADPFQIASGAFKSNGLQFPASRIHSKWDLAHS